MLLAAVLAFAWLHVASTQLVDCNGSNCQCPTSSEYKGTKCILQCNQVDVCKGKTLACRNGDDCEIHCGAYASCASGTLISAQPAADVSVICSGIDSCKSGIHIVCGSGDCALQCDGKASCDDWGQIDVTHANSFQCTGDCPVTKLPPYFSPARTDSPTQTPTMATAPPSSVPTVAPVPIPTSAPTRLPTMMPTVTPTGTPTAQPSSAPSSNPTRIPTVAPSASPSFPSFAPTIFPTRITILSSNPSKAPTSAAPSAMSSIAGTSGTAFPTASYPTFRLTVASTLETSATNSNSYVALSTVVDVEDESSNNNDDITSIDVIRQRTPNGLPPLMWINGVIGIFVVACCCCSVLVIKRLRNKRYGAVHGGGKSSSYLFREYDQNAVQNDQCACVDDAASGQSIQLHEVHVAEAEADSASDHDCNGNDKHAVLMNAAVHAADQRKRTFEQHLESGVAVGNLVLDDIIREMDTSGASHPRCNIFSPSSKSAMSNPLSEGRAPLPPKPRSFDDRKYEEEPQENDGLIKSCHFVRHKLNDRLEVVKRDEFQHEQYGDENTHVSYTLRPDLDDSGFAEC